MNIEEVRDYALSMDDQVTERLFADKWLSWRICGKWFLLTELDTPEPWVAVKLEPEVLIHEDDMSFLHLQVLHLRQHVFVDGRCRTKVG